MLEATRSDQQITCKAWHERPPAELENAHHSHHNILTDTTVSSLPPTTTTFSKHAKPDSVVIAYRYHLLSTHHHSDKLQWQAEKVHLTRGTLDAAVLTHASGKTGGKTGGKAGGADGKSQKSHSAKAGLQVRTTPGAEQRKIESGASRFARPALCIQYAGCEEAARHHPTALSRALLQHALHASPQPRH